MKRGVLLFSVLISMAFSVHAFSFQPRVSPIAATGEIGLFGNNSIDIGAAISMDFMFTDHLGFGLDTYFTTPIFALGGMMPLNEANKYAYNIVEHDTFAYKIFTMPNFILKESDSIKGPSKLGLGLLFSYQNIENILKFDLGISAIFGSEVYFTDFAGLDSGFFLALPIYEFALGPKSSHDFFPVSLLMGGYVGIKFKI